MINNYIVGLLFQVQLNLWVVIVCKFIKVSFKLYDELNSENHTKLFYKLR